MSVTKYGSLVQDRIPEIIEASGITCVTEILSDDAYLRMIESKLNGIQEVSGSIPLISTNGHVRFYKEKSRNCKVLGFFFLFRHSIGQQFDLDEAVFEIGCG